jgi:hypothetical protein
MLFFTNREYHGQLKTKVNSLIGPQYSLKEQLRYGFVGSSLLRLTKVNIDDSRIGSEALNTRCNIEKRPKGLMIKFNYKYKLLNCVIDYVSVEKVTIINNEEKIDPLFYGPMNLLMKMGVHVRYARYFRLNTFEYSSQRMDLVIQMKNGFISFDSHGYNFYEVVDYFTGSSLQSKLDINNKTCVQQRV